MAFLFSKFRASASMRRSTLREMLGMDSARLSDMGLTHFDVAEAMRSANAAQFLDARRNERAAGWLR